MITERLLDEIHTDIRELRGEVKELHKEVIVLKTEKKVSIAFLTVIVSTITTFLYKIFDISIR